MKTAQLRNRIVIYFVGSTLLTSALFGLSSFLFAYNIEDQFFYDLLKDEAKVVQTQLSQGQAAQPKLDFIRYFQTQAQLPSVVLSLLLEEPNRREFAGENDQHFHLLKLKQQQGYLLAEVSDHLVVRKITEGMVYFLLFVCAFACLIAIIMGFASYKIAKRLLKPLDNLMVILNNAPVDKLPQGFATEFKNDEIGTFAKTLESALDRIRAFISREQVFTRDVSHELRTPVTISQGALTLLKQTSLDQQQTSLVQRIDSAQQQIEQSLTVLLALAREDQLGQGKSRLLAAIEQSIIQQYDHLDGKDIELTVDVGSLIEVPVEKTSLLILLNNLLGNAFKYTSQGRITISFANNTLLIEDTGQGIKNDEQLLVFDEGVKGKNSQGLGLGLNIVKRLCEKLALQYTLTSDSSGTQVEIIF
ncbi:Adaptive-response sensory-kinase SasA [Pseudoalteromonas holothuriae]|uniref:histidine kinase n=1 Tax=Pseudoalteromonas holothuriae TaxID=2963714 RepID=A0A9W4QUS7_9GAMM|nr:MULTISPECIES: HAMP domain-containing sensor histidine kinase [unclassified Pseudoalteromonas]CAH9053906.1 Adaptive-response sensory-kinase SasA [Pseudoalteromonas sp. CIP111854]CAH9064410.1 Adaptive-response sensory-kinase SasA [Pseudoalteromonas sp. CIP111951]